MNHVPSRRWALFLLTLVYLSNCMDRTIIAVLGEAIKNDLGLSNAQLGLLGGLSFALFYSILGIPIARLAERHSRVLILTIAISVWSGMTALCALASSFLFLAVCRMGVGVGEAGCSPAAHSLISDYYEARRRASALAIYSAGCSAGQILIALGGSWIAEHYGWRTAFVAAGLPGLVLAVLIRVPLREPARGASDRPAGAGPAAAALEPSSLTALAARLLRNATVRNAVAGCVLATVAGYGIHQFTAPYFIRAFGVSYSQAGLAFGLTVGVASAVGLLVGGLAADRAGARDARWYVGVPAIGILLTFPAYVLGFVQGAWIPAALILIVPGVLHFTYLAPTLSLLHNFVRPNERATASAILLFLLSLIGFGVGPWFAGVAIDWFSARTGSPGTGTRLGLIATATLFVWSALHYALAVRHYPRDFAPVRSLD